MSRISSTFKVLSLLLDPTEVLARVLGPVEEEEQLHDQQSMLRRKTRLVDCFCYLNVFVTCCVGRCGRKFGASVDGRCVW